MNINDGYKEVIEGELLTEIIKPEAGQQYGKQSEAEPVNHSSEELSRLTDVLYNAEQLGLRVREIFAMAPETMRLEWRFSNWQYVPAR